MKQFLFLLLTIFVANFSIQAQQAEKVQRKMIGKSVESIEFTDHIANVPADINFNNKFKVLEFWATWCKPCLDAVPHLNELQNEFANRDDIIFVSVGYEKPKTIEQTLTRIPFEMMVVSDQTWHMHNEFKIATKNGMALPRTILVDEKNTILWYGHPDQLTKELIKDFLNE